MAQTLLGFQYEEDAAPSKMTALAGLPVFLDLMVCLGLLESLRVHLDGKAEEGTGWSFSDVILSLILMNLAGGDCVEDLEQLNVDLGLCRTLDLARKHGMSRQQRRYLKRRMEKLKLRGIPSSSAAFRRLETFHDPKEEEEKERVRLAAEDALKAGKKEKKSYIQKPNAVLRQLQWVQKKLIAAIIKRQPLGIATLDQDATLVQTHKSEASYCYKHYKAYQPLNTYWAEAGLLLHTEFRDGNVPAGSEQLRVFIEALENLPEGIREVYLRSDTAGYQVDLLRYCAEGLNERFGVIRFAIGVDVTEEFKKAAHAVETGDWHPLQRQVGGELEATLQEWAEVCFVPNWLGHKKHGPQYRFFAIREPLRQLELPGVEKPQADLPFPTTEFRVEEGDVEKKVTYKIFGMVSNRKETGDEIIRWHRERCGASEQAHAVMKDDLAGGCLPSGKFGVNAAWWQIMQLAFNLSVAMKRLVLGGNWATRRMKALRFHFICLAGRVIETGRQIKIKLSAGHPSFSLLQRARDKIGELMMVPGTS